jgi:hypothetical protein
MLFVELLHISFLETLMTKSNDHLSGETLVDVILPETKVNIEIGTGYYRELQLVVKHLVGDKTESEISNKLERLSKGEDVEPWVVHYHTLLRLCVEFETSAVNQGFTKKVPFKEFITMFET